jgi:hypothetical protein
MNRNLPNNSNNSLRSGVRLSRITMLIAEQWPGIWRESVDRQKQQLQSHHNL